MAPLVALTREITPAIACCELTHLAREPIDLVRARRQHAEYERALNTLGCDVRQLPAEADMADAVFIEDTAIVLDELAVLLRPGARSRRRETAAVGDALRPHRTVHEIAGPATVDGGDVLVVGRRIFVGLSSRTTRDAVAELSRLLTPFGYMVDAVPIGG